MWPTNLGTVAGRIPPSEQAETGRVLGRLSDLGWGDRLRGLLGDGQPDGSVPAEMAAAMVEVLKDWATGDDRWERRPAAIVGIASSRHGRLIRSLAEHIASVGRLPLIGAVQTRPVEGRANSAHRVRALLDAIAVPEDLAEAVALVDGPILLVDDYIDSGWTMAIAARALRQAGAQAVLPLALGQSA
jgi:ATP-dependent DNA helicase RecQ